MSPNPLDWNEVFAVVDGRGGLPSVGSVSVKRVGMGYEVQLGAFISGGMWPIEDCKPVAVKRERLFPTIAGALRGAAIVARARARQQGALADEFEQYAYEGEGVKTRFDRPEVKVG